MSVSYEKVKKAIDEWDPIELLITHAPSDEYDGESKEIFNTLKNNPSIGIGELSRLIHIVFTKAFGDDVFRNTLSECERIARSFLE